MFLNGSYGPEQKAPIATKALYSILFLSRTQNIMS